MARRSPPLVNQKYETGCTWRMFRIFNFCEDRSDRTLVSKSRHLNTHATGNGKSRSSSDVLSKIDEKYPHIAVSSRRRRDYSCKSISVENDQVADWENEETKMIVNQRLFNKNFRGKDGAGSQPDQFLDAVQILYSNKELFVNLLQDPNSLLVKQIHDLQSSQVKESYQARQKRMTGLNKSKNSNARQYVEHFETSDRYNSSSNCEARCTKNIVVLKPGRADTSYGCHRPNSSNSFSSNAQNIKPSHFPFGRMKRKLRHVMRVRRKEQQRKTTDAVPCKYPCGSQGLEYGKDVKELEIAERSSPINVHASTGKGLNLYLDLKKRDKVIKLKDSELCMDQEAASFGESCGPVTERMRYHNNHQMVLRTKLGLQRDGENGSCSSSAQKIKDPLVATFNTLSDELQLFGADISVRKSLPGDNFHAHYDIPRDGGYKDSPTQNLDTNNTTGGGLGSFQDSHPEIQILSFSPDVASSSPSSSQRIEDTVNMRNRVEQPNTESVVEQFTGNDVINSPIATCQPDGSPVQVIHDELEENHLADLIRSSLEPMNKLTSSKDILREILQAFSLKCDELMKSDSSNLLIDPSSFDELEGLTGQLSGSTILHDCIIETFMELCQNYGFPPHFSSKNPNFQAHVVGKVLIKEITELVNLHFSPHPSPMTLRQLVEKDFARRGSWLNIEVDTQDIAIEVEKDVMDKLVWEIASEMDVRDMNPCLLVLGGGG